MTYHFVDGKATSAIETNYRKLGNGWVLRSARFVTFDAKGRRSADMNYSWSSDARFDIASSLESTRLGVPTDAQGVKNLFLPPQAAAHDFGEIDGGMETAEEAAGRCGAICATAAFDVSYAAAAAALAVKTAYDACGLTDPNDCQTAVDLAKLAYEAGMRAVLSTAACQACLVPQRLINAIAPGSRLAGSGGAGAGAGACSDWYLITYNLLTGEVISVKYLGCL